jgi:hypothetical protein
MDLPPGWIDSEAGLAHAQEIPITVFKHRTVVLQGLLGANTTQWFDFDFSLETPATYFLQNVVALKAHFDEVKKGVQARRDQRKAGQARRTLDLVGIGALAYALGASSSEPDYPHCFGTYDGRETECRECGVNTACRKQRDKRR